MFFSDAQVDYLYEGLAEVDDNYRDLRDRFASLRLQNADAREHADHGFSRRWASLHRCVERVFQLLPPEQEGVPERTDAIDATLTIQAFVMNAFGCCENLAWLWVLERDVRDNGAELTPTRIGLGPNYHAVWMSFSQEFRGYLRSRRAWFKHLKDFRDSLAHRIPLYIPPFSVDPENASIWSNLGREADTALLQGDLMRESLLRDQQRALQHFSPIMTHSFASSAPYVIFHAQMLADFNTVHEIGTEFLLELNEPPN